MESRAKSITFLMPGRGSKGPAGGYKVIYEYANRLIRDGYTVSILYPLTVNFKKQSLFWKLRVIPRFFIWCFKGISGKKWFTLNPQIKSKMVLSLNWSHIPKSDIYIATGVRTAYYLKEYPIPSDHKFYFIQDYENWGVSNTYVDNSYKLGLKNIVVSKWLLQKITEAGTKAEIIKNGFDFTYFTLSTPIEQRDSMKIAMLYHNDERKGCKYGLAALMNLKLKYPKLKASLFGVPSRPIELPDWIEYYQTPSKEQHNAIYNSAAIYLAPSLQEGWGLTVGEAMICGAAVVCTNTLGFNEMVTNEQTGVMVPAGNTDALVFGIERLIQDQKLRMQIAHNGHETIKAFTWEESYKKLQKLIDTV